nr:hypothetical protein GCM10020185_68340 [Pseudomonas brassicacearum subsp. brassicacearum]
MKLAEPDKEVYALVGDGSYMMLHSELATSIQERRKVNVVLLDNMTFGCINNLQMEHGMDSFGTEFRFRNPETGKLDGGFCAGGLRHECRGLWLQDLQGQDPR